MASMDLRNSSEISNLLASKSRTILSWIQEREVSLEDVYFTCPPFQQTTGGRQRSRSLGRLFVFPRRGFPGCRSLSHTSTLGSLRSSTGTWPQLSDKEKRGIFPNWWKEWAPVEEGSSKFGEWSELARLVHGQSVARDHLQLIPVGLVCQYSGGGFILSIRWMRWLVPAHSLRTWLQWKHPWLALVLFCSRTMKIDVKTDLKQGTQIPSPHSVTEFQSPRYGAVGMRRT